MSPTQPSKLAIVNLTDRKERHNLPPNFIDSKDEDILLLRPISEEVRQYIKFRDTEMGLRMNYGYTKDTEASIRQNQIFEFNYVYLRRWRGVSG